MERMHAARQPAEPAARRGRGRRVIVGPAHDPAEREADELAARAVDTLRTGRYEAAAATSLFPGPSRIQRASVAPVGSEGGEVDDDVQAALDRSAGRGTPLDGSVRRSMEHAFGGADFGHVRMHENAEAGALNDRLGARAFTLGSDIYLGADRPSLASSAGQHLLAHELAHTLQQGSGPSASARRVVRRLSSDKPITKITSIDVMQEGASGLVAEVSDGSKPVIVKANQSNAAEVIAADRLLHKGKFASGNWKVKAPRSRIATTAEVNLLLARAQVPGVMTAAPPRNFLTGLGQANPTLVVDKLPGENFRNLANDAAGYKATWNDTTKKTEFHYSAPDQMKLAELLELLGKTAPFKAMGKAAASDGAMGMGDRLISVFNGDNFTYDRASKRFGFIDNTFSNAAGYLTSKLLPAWQTNARANFNDWSRLTYVQHLAGSRSKFAVQIVKSFTGVAAKKVTNEATAPDYKKAVGGITDPFATRSKDPAQVANNNARRAAKDDLEQAIEANYDSMVAAVRSGADSGLKSITGLLAEPLKLTAGLAGTDRHEAVTSLLARRAVLLGASDRDVAWEDAHRRAHRLLKAPYTVPGAAVAQPVATT